MRNGLPCYGKEDDFNWGTNVLSVDKDNGTMDIVASPVNSVCLACDNYNQCLKTVIEWTKVQERNENIELKTVAGERQERVIN